MGIGSPDISPVGTEILREGEWKISLDYFYRRAKDKVQITTDRWQSLVLGVGHQVSKRLFLAGYIPFVFNERNLDLLDVQYHTRGLGDVTLNAKYFPGETSPEKFNLFTELGLKIPTGKDDQKEPADPYAGGYAANFIQRGSGTWDPIIGVGVNKSVNALFISANVRYIFTRGENRAHYDAANLFSWSINTSYRLLEFKKRDRKGYWSALLGISGLRIRGHDKLNDQNLTDTGGSWTYLSPGLAFSPPGERSIVYLLVTLPPIASSTRSSQEETQGYKVSFGTAYYF